MMKFEESRKIFSEAGNRMRHGDILEAFDLYCDVLLDRLSREDDDLDFILFFRSQLVKYLRQKRSLFLSLAEGDMISDLIYSTYEDFLSSLRSNPFVKTAKGRFRLLMSVKIVFPIQNDTCFEPESKIVSK